MKYLLLIYDEATANPAAPPPADDDVARMMTAYDAFTAECRERGVYLGGDALQNVGSATTVRVRNGEMLTTDGPFAETKEALGGYYLLDCRDIDEALELAEPLAAYPYFHAARADLLRRLGRSADARLAYERARSLTANAAERAFLGARIGAIAGTG